MNGIIVVIGIVGLAICICAAMGSEAETKQEQQQAKLPAVFSTLLIQEFPPFAADFTFSACQGVATWMNSFGASFTIAQHLTWGGEADPRRARELGLVLAEKVAPAFSESFAQHMRENPEESAVRFMRAFNTAKVMAKG